MSRDRSGGVSPGGARRPVHRLEDTALGNTSYLVEVGSGLAVTLDAPRDADRHLELADRLGLRVVAALDTHLHADFIGGAREVSDAVGAEIVAPAEAHLEFNFLGVTDGDVVGWGDSKIRVLGTPGHTPEHVGYLVANGGVPRAVLTGGALIDGGAARTDLVAPELTEPLARAEFHTLRRLAELPDEVAVYPTHGAGSFCTAASPANGAATIGAHKRSNPLMAINDADAFVRTLLEGYGSFPPYFLRLRDVNRAGPPLIRDLGDVEALEPAEVADAVERGAWLVDARPVGEWARAHPSGAVSISIEGAFATWLGWVVEIGEPIVLIARPGDLSSAVRQARRIGHDRILGYLAAAPETWREAGLAVSTVDTLDPVQASRRHGDGWTLLDVRRDAEVGAGRIPGAAHLELADIIAGAVPEADAVVTYCGHGERSATAASLLERRGMPVASVAGGVAAWRDAGLPLA